jgi:hypothetical protein
MANGYTRSPKLLKGALIQFSAPLLIPIPNIIIFQYNPETLSRTLSPWAPPEKDEQGKYDPKVIATLAQPYDPQESFNLNLELDATDALEEPKSHPVAFISGVADRIAAIEMLMYPPEDSALGGLLNVSVSVSIGGGGFSASATKGRTVTVAKRKSVPVVLFFWGPGRIVPVRITSCTVDEQAFSPILYPTRAKVTLGMKILDAAAFDNQKQTAAVKIAKACYKITRAQKEALALANIANSVESIMGILPF